MTVTSLGNYSQIVAVGLPQFRLQITNWGNHGATQDATSLSYGTLPSQLLDGAHAVVIGPDSTVDRVAINYNAVFNVGASNPNLNKLQQIVSVVRPASNQLAGPITVDLSAGPGNGATGGGLADYYNDTYYRDGDPVVKPFGGAEALFEKPFLQLDIYLRSALLALPLQRNPMFRSFGVAVPDLDGAEQLIAIWPVQGRQRATVAFRATGTLVASVRTGLITYGFDTVAATETTAAIATVNAVSGVQALATFAAPIQYLAAYVTFTSGAGNIVGHMLAEDLGSCGTCVLG